MGFNPSELKFYCNKNTSDYNYVIRQMITTFVIKYVMLIRAYLTVHEFITASFKKSHFRYKVIVVSLRLIIYKE